jgi:hypothetical protein
MSAGEREILAIAVESVDQGSFDSNIACVAGCQALVRNKDAGPIRKHHMPTFLQDFPQKQVSGADRPQFTF